MHWSEGRNVQIDIRWGEDKIDLERKYAAELVALAPEVILASGTMSVAALQSFSRTLPIVFAAVADPVGAGFVESLSHPGRCGRRSVRGTKRSTFAAQRVRLLSGAFPTLPGRAIGGVTPRLTNSLCRLGHL